MAIKFSQIAPASNPLPTDTAIGVQGGTTDVQYTLSSITRTRLTANTTLYVALTGSDVTGNGSVGNPWATPQHAYDVVANQYDLAGFNLTIQCGDGIYSNRGAILRITSVAWTGGGALTFQGNLSDRTKVRWYVNANVDDCIEVQDLALPGLLSFTNIQLVIQGTGDALFSGRYIGSVLITNCDFGGGGACFDLSNTFGGQNMQIQGSWTFLTAGLPTPNPGFIDAQAGSVTLIIASNVNVEGGTWDMGGGNFIQCNDFAFVEFASSVISGTYIGPKFFVATGGIIEAFQGPIYSDIPGTVQGTFGSGGIYHSSEGTYVAGGNASLDAGINYQVPTTGFSITLGNANWHLILDPSGSLGSGTIIMPAHPVDGQIINIRSSQIITTLTISPNSGQTVLGAPTTIAAGGITEGIYRAANTTWYF